MWFILTENPVNMYTYWSVSKYVYLLGTIYIYCISICTLTYIIQIFQGEGVGEPEPQRSARVVSGNRYKLDHHISTNAFWYIISSWACFYEYDISYLIQMIIFMNSFGFTQVVRNVFCCTIYPWPCFHKHDISFLIHMNILINSFGLIQDQVFSNMFSDVLFRFEPVSTNMTFRTTKIKCVCKCFMINHFLFHLFPQTWQFSLDPCLVFIKINLQMRATTTTIRCWCSPQGWLRKQVKPHPIQVWLLFM